MQTSDDDFLHFLAINSHDSNGEHGREGKKEEAKEITRTKAKEQGKVFSHSHGNQVFLCLVLIMVMISWVCCHRNRPSQTSQLKVSPQYATKQHCTSDTDQPQCPSSHSQHH